MASPSGATSTNSQGFTTSPTSAAGAQVFYRFGDGYQYRPPNFMPAELAMLLLAQQSIAATGLASFGTPFAGYGRALLAKVRSTLPKGLRDYLDALASVFGTAAVPTKD